MEHLAAIARAKKQEFLHARAAGANFETMQRLGLEYGQAIAAWHKVRFPNKRFKMPTAGYLMRAL